MFFNSLFFSTGTAHGDELGYLFARAPVADKLKYPTLNDFSTIKKMTSMWTNFARTGLPTPDASLGVRWTPVTSSSYNPDLVNTRYLDIGAQLTMHEEDLNAERSAFWRNLAEQQQTRKF
ncbi:hypothetical protein B566_EDAN014097 [Ephemera danica]|nr:hypothetical protein B566_EDAN014097 [Ephemera danica]